MWWFFKKVSDLSWYRSVVSITLCCMCSSIFVMHLMCPTIWAFLCIFLQSQLSPLRLLRSHVCVSIHLSNPEFSEAVKTVMRSVPWIIILYQFKYVYIPPKCSLRVSVIPAHKRSHTSSRSSFRWQHRGGSVGLKQIRLPEGNKKANPIRCIRAGVRIIHFLSLTQDAVSCKIGKPPQRWKLLPQFHLSHAMSYLSPSQGRCKAVAWWI